jgi:hypothetical protein
VTVTRTTAIPWEEIQPEVERILREEGERLAAERVQATN